MRQQSAGCFQIGVGVRVGFACDTSLLPRKREAEDDRAQATGSFNAAKHVVKCVAWS
jgi:hypothetical protein